MALVFPVGPTIGDLYPPDPGTSGVTQYIYTGDRWNAVTSNVSLGTANQGAFNNYTWPATPGSPDLQLTTDGTGNLSWDVPAAPSLQVLSLLEPFDGTNIAFTFITNPGAVPFTPTPSSNVVVFLGGVPQIPGVSFSVASNTITFTEAPLVGSTFYAISSVIA
jgi:hypothetical protein